MKRAQMSVVLLATAAMIFAGVGSANAGTKKVIGNSSVPSRRYVVSVQEGRVFKNEDAGIQIKLPEGWKAEPKDELISISPPDASVNIMFWALGDASFDDAIDTLDKELSKIFKHVKVTSPAKEDSLNGMRTVGTSGTGDIDGVTLEWSVDVIKAKKPVIVLCFAAPEALEKHADEFVEFVKSVKKIED